MAANNLRQEKARLQLRIQEIDRQLETYSQTTTSVLLVTAELLRNINSCTAVFLPEAQSTITVPFPSLVASLENVNSCTADVWRYSNSCVDIHQQPIVNGSIYFDGSSEFVYDSSGRRIYNTSAPWFDSSCSSRDYCTYNNWSFAS